MCLISGADKGAVAKPSTSIAGPAAGIDMIHSLTLVALALVYGGALLAVWSLFTYLSGTWVHFRCSSPFCASCGALLSCSVCCRDAEWL